MKPDPTPEPSAEALAAANDIMRDFPVIYGFGYELARIIDAEFAALRAERDKLDAVRLAALQSLAYHVGAITESHIENKRLEHAFVLDAHRILATGEPDGVLKGSAKNIESDLRARLERAEEAVEWAAFKFEEEGFAERAAYCREQIQCEGGAK